MTDQEILDLNNGRILPGDKVVISGNRVNIPYTTNSVDSINVVLEKNGTDVEGYLNGNQPVPCEDGIQKTFSWLCNIVPDLNYEYPKYRIKIVSQEPQGVIAYSNYFKVSVKRPFDPDDSQTTL